MLHRSRSVDPRPLTSRNPLLPSRVAPHIHPLNMMMIPFQVAGCIRTPEVVKGVIMMYPDFTSHYELLGNFILIGDIEGRFTL